ncbi:MAG: alpha/beta hydrolase [Blastocatellia bacterium]|nr:alpha/beta hydrolase [Blastocatellia bacterium]
MKSKILLVAIWVLMHPIFALGQKPNPYVNVFPPGTIIHDNVPYNNDADPRHLLDLYLPVKANGKIPLVIFVHGGGWISNDKYADMGYMKKTIAEIVSSGFALASIDYRLATQAAFPALIQDCNRAASFLYDNANKYGLDRTRFAVMGFSAGGHLAALMGLSKNNNVAAFFMPKTTKTFRFKAVVDFYGPSELTSLKSSDDHKSPEAVLLGAAPLARPDLAKIASPVTYVDKNDPPFLIFHGEKDNLVPNQQSKLLHGWLQAVGVPSELIIVKDAPHFGAMYDVDEIRNKVIRFLKKQLS